MVLVFSLIYASLGAALKLVMALCLQSGQHNVCKIRFILQLVFTVQAQRNGRSQVNSLRNLGSLVLYLES
jgi:hypothetical protein